MIFEHEVEVANYDAFNCQVQFKDNKNVLFVGLPSECEAFIRIIETGKYKDE